MWTGADEPYFAETDALNKRYSERFIEIRDYDQRIRG
jgi:hypothetical protein